MCPNAITEEINAALTRASGDINAAAESLLGKLSQIYDRAILRDPKGSEKLTQQSSSADQDNLSPRQLFPKYCFTVF